MNVGKTKIMRCRRGSGREAKRTWRWKGKIIEEVKEFKYLGYVLQKNRRQEAHIKDRVRRAATGMGQIWGLGKRRFGGDWGRRIWLFDRLIWTGLSYGVEVWGWEEREGIEKTEERYMRWLLGVEKRTLWYMMREELQKEKLRGRAGRRAWEFEKRLEEGRGGGLARDCLEEIRERFREERTLTCWEREREKFFEERGVKREEVEEKNREEENWINKIEERDKEKQRKERWEKIKDSKYNKWR